MNFSKALFRGPYIFVRLFPKWRWDSSRVRKFIFLTSNLSKGIDIMKYYFIIVLYKKHKQILKKMSKYVKLDKTETWFLLKNMKYLPLLK